MISKIKEYWNKFSVWESTEITFDRGWALYIVVGITSLVMFK